MADGQMAVLDDLDRQIVAAMRANGRLSMRALAGELHISRANAYARVDRLERAGVITGYSATINPQKYGYGLSAYVFLNIAQQSWKKVRNQMLSIPEVDHAALVSGEHDLMLLVRTRDAAALRDLVLTRLQGMPEVNATQTVLIFDELSPRETSTWQGMVLDEVQLRPGAQSASPVIAAGQGDRRVRAWSGSRTAS